MSNGRNWASPVMWSYCWQDSIIWHQPSTYINLLVRASFIAVLFYIPRISFCHTINVFLSICWINLYQWTQGKSQNVKLKNKRCSDVRCSCLDGGMVYDSENLKFWKVLQIAFLEDFSQPCSKRWRCGQHSDGMSCCVERNNHQHKIERHYTWIDFPKSSFFQLHCLVIDIQLHSLHSFIIEG